MRTILFTISFLAICTVGFGQKTIKGRVIDNLTEVPLKGVNVIILGSTNGTMTNDSGYFEFERKYKNSIARLSYTGYANYDIKLATNSSILVKLSRTAAMISTMNIGLGEYSGPSQYLEYEEPENDFPIEEETADEVYVVVEEPANFYMGLDNLYAYFAANFQYPQKVLEENLSGTVFIEFTVLSDGSVDEVKFLKDDVLTEVQVELKRLFTIMPKWTSAMQRGEKVNQTFVLPIQYAANR